MVKVIGGKIPPKEHKKLQIEDALDDIFERVVFAKPLPPKGIRRDCLFLPHHMGPMWADVGVERDDIGFFHPDDVNSPELIWPVGVGLITHGNNSEWGNHILCQYWQSEPAKRLRGGHRFVGRKNLGHYHGYLAADMQFHSVVNYAAWHFGRWRNIEPIRYDESFIALAPNAGAAPLAQPRVAVGEDDIGARCALGQSVALTYRYEWGAQFSIDGSARIVIPATPRGILELFNDRDKPCDRDRRAALRHWVSQHRRRKRGGDFSLVREHLRGSTKFSWRGFDVEIKPSQFDMERAP